MSISSKENLVAASTSKPPILIGIIGDIETTLGFLMAGIGDKKAHNFMIVTEGTPQAEIEQFFTRLYNRKDMGVILINSDIMEGLSVAIENARRIKPTPILIEVPTRTSLMKELERQSEQEVIVTKLGGSDIFN